MKGQTRVEFIFGIIVFCVLIFYIVNQINTIFSSSITDYESNTVKAEAENVIGLLTNYAGEPQDWNSAERGWEKRKRIEISPSGSDEFGQQIKLNITWNSNMREDFGDMRFTDSNMVTGIPYWIEDKVDSSYADVWVRIPKIPSYGKKYIYIYYGNSEAIYKGDGNGVFLQFLDLSGTSLPDGWVKTDIGTSGTASISNGVLTVTNTNGRDIWYSTYEATHAYYNSTLSGDFVAVAKITGQRDTSSWARAGISLQNSVRSRNYNGMSVFFASPGNGYALTWQHWNDYVTSPDDYSQSGSAAFPSYLKIVRNNSKVSGFYSTDTNTWIRVGQDVVPLAIEDFQYATLVVSPVNYQAVGEANFSMFYVYNYMDKEPNIIFNGEESEGQGSWFPLQSIGLLDRSSGQLSNEKIDTLNSSCDMMESVVSNYRLKVYNSSGLILSCGSESLKPPKVTTSKNVMIGGSLGSITLELW